MTTVSFFSTCNTNSQESLLGFTPLPTAVIWKTTLLHLSKGIKIWKLWNVKDIGRAQNYGSADMSGSSSEIVWDVDARAGATARTPGTGSVSRRNCSCSWISGSLMKGVGKTILLKSYVWLGDLCSVFTASKNVPTELLVFSNWNSVLLLADFNHSLWQNLTNRITTGYNYLSVQIEVYLNRQKSIRKASVEDLLRSYGPSPSQSTTKSDQLLCCYIQSSSDILKGWRFCCGTM